MKTRASKQPEPTTQTPSKLAVIVPSRGLMFSETLEELLGELEGFNYEIFWSHAKGLPECFNEPTEKALADPDVFAILYCEDDMILPKGILKEMFAVKYPVTALQYPFKYNGDSTCLHDPEGMAYFTGTGFMLVAKAILEQVEKPIWRTDTTFHQFIDKDTIHWWPYKLSKIAYGLHDLYFGIMLYSSGVPIYPMVKTAGQRKLVKLGEKHTNNGSHNIQELTRTGKNIVTGMIDEENANLFLGAMNRVKHTKIWTETPPFISYDEEEQPYVNDGREFTRTR